MAALAADLAELHAARLALVKIVTRQLNEVATVLNAVVNSITILEADAIERGDEGKADHAK